MLLDDLESRCEAAVFIDAMEGYTCEKARLDRAGLVVSTVESTGLSDRLLELAADSDVDVVLRARSVSMTRDFLSRGALFVTPGRNSRRSSVVSSSRLSAHTGP